MSSSIKLTNSSGKIVTITNPDTTSADVAVDLLNNAYTIATVDDFGTVPVGYTTVIVTDTDRGGIFVWSASGTANGGTVFAGSSGYSWERQYDGAVNVKWFGAVAGVSTIDNSIAINEALAVSNNISIDAIYYVDGLIISNERARIVGNDSLTCGFAQTTGASNTFTVELNARLITMENLYIIANSSSKCIYVANGQLCRINNVVTKFGRYGLYLESCNSISIQQFFAESCFIGVQTAPISDGNTNGMRIEGRSYNCEFGFKLENPNAATHGVMNSTITYSTEGNTVGWYENNANAAAYYNNIDLYSESNTRTSTDSPANTNEDFVMAGFANYYMIKNPDHKSVSDLFTGKSTGFFTSGTVIQPAGAYSGNKIGYKTVTYSQSLYFNGENVILIYNPNAATYNLTLRVDTIPVGGSVLLVSQCTAYGINLLPPSGFTWNQTSMNIGAYTSLSAPATTLIIRDGETSFQAIRLN